MLSIEIKTDSRESLYDISGEIRKIIDKNEWENGILLLHCPHTTAGLTINESADPDVRRDICQHLKKLIPKDPKFLHAEGNSDAHIKSSLMGPQLYLIIHEGVLQLGTWQGIYFCEWDGPRNRNLWLKFLPDK